MVFGRVVCRDARSRASRHSRQPALLVSGGHTVGRPLYDWRVETHQWGRDILPGGAATVYQVPPAIKDIFICAHQFSSGEGAILVIFPKKITKWKIDKRAR